MQGSENWALRTEKQSDWNIAVEKLRAACPPKPEGVPPLGLPPPLEGFGGVKPKVKLEFPHLGDHITPPDSGAVAGGGAVAGAIPVSQPSYTTQNIDPKAVNTKTLGNDPRVSEILSAYLSSTGQFQG